MSDLRDRYLACWNETDAQRRGKLLAATFAPAATYVDPLAEASGLDALGAVIAAVHDQFPEFVFTTVGDVDQHHDVARFAWGLGPAGQEPPVLGFDVVVIDTDGKITAVAGFLDRVPAPADAR